MTRGGPRSDRILGRGTEAPRSCWPLTLQPFRVSGKALAGCSSSLEIVFEGPEQLTHRASEVCAKVFVWDARDLVGELLAIVPCSLARNRCPTPRAHDRTSFASNRMYSRTLDKRRGSIWPTRPTNSRQSSSLSFGPAGDFAAALAARSSRSVLRSSRLPGMNTAAGVIGELYNHAAPSSSCSSAGSKR
jgi:hypothetical protein